MAEVAEVAMWAMPPTTACYCGNRVGDPLLCLAIWSGDGVKAHPLFELAD